MFENLPFPSLFVCFLIFIAWMHYEKRKASREEKRRSDAFWQQEEKANHSRNKDISGLPFFHPDTDKIPLIQTSDENIIYYQKQVLSSADLPMMNLSQYTNTDLKLAYGVGNFKTLSDYDENFNVFLMNLSNLAKAYREADFLTEAASVYRLCLDYGSDKSTDYRALGSTYSALKETGKLLSLIDEVKQSDLPRRDALTESLEQLLPR